MDENVTVLDLTEDFTTTIHGAVQDYTLMSNATTNDTTVITSNSTLSYAAAMTLGLALIVLVCGGNLLTVLTLWKTRYLRNIACMYQISFATANMGTGISIALIVVMSTLHLWNLLDPRTQCLLFNTMLWTPLVASLEALSMLVADRFIFTVFPFRYNLLVTAGRTKILVVSTWVLALLVVLVGIVPSRWQPGQLCQMSYAMSPAYNVVVTLIYVLSSLQSLVMVVTVAREMRRVSMVSVTPVERTRMKALTIVVVMTLLCWLPMIVAGLVWLGREQPPGISMVCASIMVGSSVAHAFVYLLVDRQYRRAVWALLRCRSRNVTQVHPESRFTPQPSQVVYVSRCPSNPLTPRASTTHQTRM